MKPTLVNRALRAFLVRSLSSALESRSLNLQDLVVNVIPPRIMGTKKHLLELDYSGDIIYADITLCKQIDSKCPQIRTVLLYCRCFLGECGADLLTVSHRQLQAITLWTTIFVITSTRKRRCSAEYLLNVRLGFIYFA